MRRKELLYSIAGIIMAVLVSIFVFFTVPGGFRIVLVKGNTTVWIGRGTSFGIPAITGADSIQENQLTKSLRYLFAPEVQIPSVNESQLIRSPQISILTLDFMIHLSASSVLTSLSWTEEDVVIPVFEKALESGVKASEAVLRDSAYFREQASKDNCILRISLDLINGSKSYVSDQRCSNYLSSLKISDPSAIEAGPIGRFSYSERLRRFYDSVNWLHFSTSVERERDPASLVILGFILGTDFERWGALSHFYRGLNDATGIDALRLSAASVNSFGGELDEDVLRDEGKLALFSKMISGDWRFPFQVSLFSGSPSLIHMKTDVGIGSMTDAIDRLISGPQEAIPSSADNLALDRSWTQLIASIGGTRTATMNEAESEVFSHSMLSSYLLLLYSCPQGLAVRFPAGGRVFLETDSLAYQSLYSFLQRFTSYLNSTSGLSVRVASLLNDSRIVNSKANELSSKGQGSVAVDAELEQKIVSLMELSSIQVPFCSKTKLDSSAYESWCIGWDTVQIGPLAGLRYDLIEAED